MSGARRFAVCASASAFACTGLGLLAGHGPANGLHLLILVSSALTIAVSLTRKSAT